MTDFYSQPVQPTPVPSLRISASEDVDAAECSIVVGYRTDSGSAVLHEAIAAARREGAALRVVAYGTDATTGPVSGSIDSIKQISLQLIEAGLEFEVQRAGEDVAQQVLDLAAAYRTPLIVLGIRRRSPVMKLFLGSSSQRILLEAECPVLTVH